MVRSRIVLNLVNFVKELNRYQGKETRRAEFIYIFKDAVQCNGLPQSIFIKRERNAESILESIGFYLKLPKYVQMKCKFN